MTKGVRAQEGVALGWALLGGGLLLAPTEPRLLALSGFLGLCALCEALEHAPSPARAFRVGLAFGTAANATALFSLIGLLQSFGRLPLLAALAIAMLAWLSHGVLFALTSLLATLAARGGTPRWLGLPLSLMTVLGLAPAVFPWHVAATQVGFLPFVQVADLGGETLVGLCLGVLACCVHGLVRAPRKRPLLALALLSLGLPCLYGVLRLPQIERLRAEAPTLAIGVAQSNVSSEQKHDERHSYQNLQGLRALTRESEAEGAELTVWGETAYPYPLLRSARRAPEDVRRVLGDSLRGPVLLGLETYDGFDESSEKYNSAWLVGRDGALAERVDKTRLLAFGEYIPLWDYLPDMRTRYASKGFAHGVPGTVGSASRKLGVLICYEDLFADSARATVALGARALVNLTNDAWFGDTREPFLHDTLARLRSVELRRDLVRAVNTGVSSFTSATGEVLQQTRTFERARFVAQVRLLDERTVYARWGDWLTPLCALALCVCLLRKRRSEAQRSETSFFTAS